MKIENTGLHKFYLQLHPRGLAGIESLCGDSILVDRSTQELMINFKSQRPTYNIRDDESIFKLPDCAPHALPEHQVGIPSASRGSVIPRAVAALLLDSPETWRATLRDLENVEALGCKFIPLEAGGLLVLATRASVYILDITAFQFFDPSTQQKLLAILQRLLENRKTLKIFHDSRESVPTMHKELGCNISPLVDTLVLVEQLRQFETQVAVYAGVELKASSGDLSKHVSLVDFKPGLSQMLMIAEVNPMIDPEKFSGSSSTTRAASWSHRPLTSALKKQAAKEVKYLIDAQERLLRKIGTVAQQLALAKCDILATQMCYTRITQDSSIISSPTSRGGESAPSQLLQECLGHAEPASSTGSGWVHQQNDNETCLGTCVIEDPTLDPIQALLETCEKLGNNSGLLPRFSLK
ncbi:hypothetical protein HDU93_007214 [Gonapodya sp. JEL0774]|nr:hypothetical protein HDU93_007214 [Gonapodya sp. JEL0774]